MSNNVSMRDIATAAGVSKAAVSRVINGRPAGIRVSVATRERILATIRQFGYQHDRFARDQALRSQATLGLVLASGGPDASAAHLPAIESVLAANGYRLFLIVLPADADAARDRVTALLHDGVAGLLCAPGVMPVVVQIVAGTCPVVAMGPVAGEIILRSLGVDIPVPVILPPVTQSAPVVVAAVPEPIIPVTPVPDPVVTPKPVIPQPTVPVAEPESPAPVTPLSSPPPPAAVPVESAPVPAPEPEPTAVDPPPEIPAGVPASAGVLFPAEPIPAAVSEPEPFPAESVQSPIPDPVPAPVYEPAVQEPLPEPAVPAPAPEPEPVPPDPDPQPLPAEPVLPTPASPVPEPTVVDPPPEIPAGVPASVGVLFPIEPMPAPAPEPEPPPAEPVPVPAPILDPVPFEASQGRPEPLPPEPEPVVELPADIPANPEPAREVQTPEPDPATAPEQTALSAP